jgi:hypothetical protein
MASKAADSIDFQLQNYPITQSQNFHLHFHRMRRCALDTLGASP